MTYQDAVLDLARLWDLLPLLVGPAWGELEPSLLGALADLAAARTDDEREQRAAVVMRLCLREPPLRQALAPAVTRDVIRGGQAEAVGWPQAGAEISAAVERSSRPGGDQWLVADLAGNPPGEPLRPGTSYDLTIAVAGHGPPADALAAEPVPPRARPDPEAESVTLTVELGANSDADIETVSSVLTLPRRGASADRARFRVTPRAGSERLTLTAVVTRDAVFVQVLTLTLRVAEGPGGAALRGRAAGLPLDEAFALDSDVTLLVANGHVWLLGCGPYARARQSQAWAALDEAAEGPRAALREMVFGVLERGRPAHQVDVAIPPDVYEECRRALLQAGALMFRALFFEGDAGAELKNLGRALEELAAHHEPLRFQVVADVPHIPWHLLAFPGPGDLVAGHPAGNEPPPILGLRHRVSYLPQRSITHRPLGDRSLRLNGAPLRVVLAVNRDIDDEHDDGPRDLVQGQLDAWRQRAATAGGALDVAEPPLEEVFDVLARNTPPGDLLYFFCHAYLNQDLSRLGPLAACLELARGQTVTLEDVALGTPPGYEFATAPLVVLNACASAVPRSAAYTSFVPFLLGRGARGVVGTEADIPAVFAAFWAREFFSRVLDGVPLADAAFELTRDLHRRYRNLLGLIYALHCDGRSLVWPAIPREPQPPASRPSAPEP